MPAAPAPQLQQSSGGGGSGGGVRHDIFVGNLAFNTTEEQLHQAFSEIGRVLNVRLVTDIETGKPKGFAFIEYQDP
jgi:RNA recognition motif-containing protein